MGLPGDAGRTRPSRPPSGTRVGSHGMGQSGQSDPAATATHAAARTERQSPRECTLMIPLTSPLLLCCGVEHPVRRARHASVVPSSERRKPSAQSPPGQRARARAAVPRGRCPSDNKNTEGGIGRAYRGAVGGGTFCEQV
eukprot:ctg_177.g91